MHERGLVSRAAAELIDSLGDSPVLSVELCIGPDTDRKVVEDAWRSVTAGTPMASARLDWVEASHELSCLDCGTGYRGRKLSICPSCGGNGLVVERAPEVAVGGWEQGDAG